MVGNAPAAAVNEPISGAIVISPEVLVSFKAVVKSPVGR